MTRYYRPLVITTFITYIFVAVWIYFFKASLGTDLRFFVWESSMNWIPFSEVFRPSGVSYGELGIQILNIIGFIPLGFFASALFKKHHFIFGSLIGITFSVLVEVAQLITSFGSPQVGDIITNSLGAIIGAILFIKLDPKVNLKIKNILYLIASISFVCLIILGIVTTSMRWSEYISNPYI